MRTAKEIWLWLIPNYYGKIQHKKCEMRVGHMQKDKAQVKLGGDTTKDRGMRGGVHPSTGPIANK